MAQTLTRLSDSEIAAKLGSLPEWHLHDSELRREIPFKTYKDGLVFAVAVGYLADQMNHHPDMLIGYRKLNITLSTHDAKGLTDLDFQLAAKIENSLS